MSSYLPNNKMSDADLVAVILGKKETDDECALFASQAMKPDTAELARDSASMGAARRLTKVEAGVELGRRAVLRERLEAQEELNTPEHIYELMRPMYLGVEHEVFYCLCLNTKNQLTKMFEMSVGTIDSSIVHPRELFKGAIRSSAASIIMVHNHPSGQPEPSRADIRLTERMIKAGHILGIPVLDHIIVGGGGGDCLSMREEGHMESRHDRFTL